LGQEDGLEGGKQIEGREFLHKLTSGGLVFVVRGWKVVESADFGDCWVGGYGRADA